MKNNNYEIALILKKVIYENSMVGYIPEKIVDGFFDDESNCFFDFEGTPYYHIIYNPDNYGFCKRMSMSELKQANPFLRIAFIKFRLLKTFKKFYYLSGVEKDYGVPIISFGNKKQEDCILFDYDILKYYHDFHKVYYDYVINKYNLEYVFVDENDESKCDINYMFNQINNRVLGQEEPIKKIISIINQHYNNYNVELSSNILINGSQSVGKKEIFNIISEMMDIPSVNINLYQNITIEKVNIKICKALEDLAKKANYNIEKAGRGILLLDGIDKVINNENIMLSLKDIFNEGGSLKTGNTEYDIDFNKMLIVGLGNFNNLNTIGFHDNLISKFTKEDLIRDGANEEILNIFTYLITMNELQISDYKTILNSESGYLNIIRKLLSSQGVLLNINEEAIELIAKECIKLKKGVKGIEEVVNNIMLNINFEIASKPNEYSDVIIDKDTVKDNSKFKLLKKSLHNS